MSLQAASSLIPRTFAFGILATHIGSQVFVAFEGLAKSDTGRSAMRVSQVFFASVTILSVLYQHQARLPVIGFTAAISIIALYIPLLNVDKDPLAPKDWKKTSLEVATIALDIITKFINIGFFVASLSLANVGITPILIAGTVMAGLNMVPTARSVFGL